MKITCQACQAKYTIADEKVLGKVVKIRCKKCGSTIVVNGSDPSATPGSETSLPDASSGQLEPPQQEDWTVNVAEGDQRTMKEDEIVRAYVDRMIDDETYCWRDGMGDWAPLREIPTLQAACMAKSRVASRGGAHAALPVGPAEAGASGAGDPAALVAAPAPAFLPGSFPARRMGGRAPAADLFGGVARAGGDDDVRIGAASKKPQVHEADDPDKLTGARNENSVLFSLSTLTGKVDRPPAVQRPDSEASGLIDIRQLSAQFASTETPKKSGLEDIMNLSGGALTPALTAPVLSPPSIEAYDAGGTTAHSLAPGPKSRWGLIAVAVGAGTLVILAAVGGAMSMMHKGADTDKATSSSESVAGEATAAPLPSATAAVATTVAAIPPAGPVASAPSDSNREEPPARAPDLREAKAPSVSAKETAAPPARAIAVAARSDQPFNMGEAKSRLGSTADGAQSCKRGDISGTGHVVVTFSPTGSVQSAVVDGPPFEGTPAGACVASRFRAVRVPAFSGSPFKVRKSFTIN
jgi:predicted Zn finger-like uncharacterized protein